MAMMADTTLVKLKDRVGLSSHQTYYSATTVPEWEGLNLIPLASLIVVLVLHEYSMMIWVKAESGQYPG